MKEQSLMFAVFGVIEHITKSELTNVSKTLIYSYYAGSELPTSRERSRDAVLRYTQSKVLPTLDEIRKKTKAELDTLEHLVLRMDYEAMKIDGTLSQFRPAAESSVEEPSSPPAARVEPPRETTSREPSPSSAVTIPTLPKTPLHSGAFSGIKTRRLPARAGKPRFLGRKPETRPARSKKAAKKTASSARPAGKKSGPRPTAKKTVVRKKKNR